MWYWSVTRNEKAKTKEQKHILHHTNVIWEALVLAGLEKGISSQIFSCIGLHKHLVFFLCNVGICLFLSWLPSFVYTHTHTHTQSTFITTRLISLKIWLSFFLTTPKWVHGYVNFPLFFCNVFLRSKSKYFFLIML